VSEYCEGIESMGMAGTSGAQSVTKGLHARDSKTAGAKTVCAPTVQTVKNQQSIVSSEVNNSKQGPISALLGVLSVVNSARQFGDLVRA
jgi:hypothetical protein